MWGSLETSETFHLYTRFGNRTTHIAPHDIQDGSTYKGVFDSAREEKRRSILDESADDVRTTTLEDVVGSLEA